MPADLTDDPNLERWSRLFDDLESGLREQALGERAAEIADRTRRERAQVTLADRLAAQTSPIELVLTSGESVSGQVGDVGTDWIALTDARTRRWLIPMAQILQISGLGRAADADRHAGTTRRFPVGWALRALARDRLPVVVHDLRGRELIGTIDAVGADFVDFSEHPIDAPRRDEWVTARRVLPLTGIVAVVTARRVLRDF